MPIMLHSTETAQVHGHYALPVVNPETWRLQIGGRVERPAVLSLDDLKALPRREVTAALECSGNGASLKFMGAIGNAKWTGTPLAPLLKDCGLAPEVIEIAF